MDLVLFFKAVVLGIVEGLTEFLPVSSTGHLIVAGQLIGYTGEKAKVFEIVIQSGAMLAVIWEYRARFGRVLRGLHRDPAARQFAFNLAVAFAPAALLGLAFGGAMLVTGTATRAMRSSLENVVDEDGSSEWPPYELGNGRGGHAASDVVHTGIVGDERDVLPSRELFDDPIRSAPLVVLVHRHQLALQAMVLEQASGDASVLGGDHVRSGERLKGARADVLKISNGRGHHI